jgi:hypothetical protein
MLQAILIGLLILMSLAGCSDPYNECIEKEKESYRQRNPKASYGQVTAKQQEFEMMCSSFKKK